MMMCPPIGIVFPLQITAPDTVVDLSVCADDCEVYEPSTGQLTNGTWRVMLMSGGPNISITTTDDDGTVRTYELDGVEWTPQDDGPCPGPVETAQIDIRDADPVS
ncbi:hypothetical protein EV141_0653 [Microcella putealis]|uniref:Uncharacterized protein n=1 Tax=Microcella putealis TaxID=337005 RepID=A0A4Q7LY81_9MICO|nr:hypothetical protein EV141_0653 [Microcella putealis]TQM20052.1 hypothetical protein BJ957_2190 [Microcella putealis]